MMLRSAELCWKDPCAQISAAQGSAMGASARTVLSPCVRLLGVMVGAVWSMVMALTSYTSNGAPRITDSWTGTPDSFKRLVQFGVDVVNGTGTAYEMAQVTVILDLRMQS